MGNDEKKELIPKRQSLFPLTPDDIVDGALQNLDEKQAREVSQKAADEVVKIAVEKRRAEYRSTAARDEMRNVVENANLLDERGGEYKINSTFETASGTTNVEIQNAKSTNFTPALIFALGFIALVLIVLAFLFFR